jgi:hypothetical protein
MINASLRKGGTKHLPFYILLCLFPNLVLAQPILRGQVIDSDKKPIPFASIGYYNHQIGSISDSLGYFQIKKINGDSIKISSLGFQFKNYTISEINGNIQIELNSIYFKLSDVIVKSRKKTTDFVWIGHFKSKNNFLSLGGVGNQIQTAIFLPNENKLSGYIDELHFKLDKFKKTTYLLRIRLFNRNSKTGLPDEDLLLMDNILKPNQLKRDVFFSIKDKNIEVPQNGFFVSFEWIPQIGITKETDSAPWIIGNLNSERKITYTNYREIKWSQNSRPIINQEYGNINIEAKISY